MVTMRTPNVIDFFGLSTDTKPTSTNNTNGIKVDQGSTFYEIDTGKTYIYRADNNTWVEKQ